MRGALALSWLAGVAAVYPDPMGYATGSRGFGNRGSRGLGGSGVRSDPRPDVPFYYVVPFVVIVVGLIAFMIWLIVSDERADAKKRDNDKRARSLKYGKADPRYAE